MSVRRFNEAFGGNPNSRNYRPGSDAVPTHEGGLAYRLDDLESVTQLVMLGLIGSSYYESEKEQLEKTKGIWAQAIALAKDPEVAEYLAKLVSYGREVGGMKFQPVLGLVYLSTLDDKRWFQQAFPHVIKTPKDAFDFLELTRKANIRKGLGRSVKTVLCEYLRGLSTYHVRRYAGKLKDIVRVCHPATMAGSQADTHISYIMRGTPGNNSELAALNEVRENLRRGAVTQHVINAIREYNMQLEELKPFFGTITMDQRRQIFDAIIPGLSISALIKNLVTIEWTYSRYERSIYDEPDCYYLTPDMIRLVRDRILDVDAYRRSRMLPFDPMMASKMVHVPEWKDALGELVDTSCKTMFDADKLTTKRIRINVDTSGSMHGVIMAGKYDGPNITIADFVGVMGSALYQAMPNRCSIWAIASTYRQVPVRTLSASRLGNDVMHTEVGHGTYFEQCMTGYIARSDYYGSYLNPRRCEFQRCEGAAYQGEDVYVLLTDGQQADNLEKAWAEARKPAGAKLIIWDVVGYGTRISNRPDIVYLRGYSSSMMDVVRRIIEDGTNQIDQIQEYTL
jgi:hypothetical protein